MKPKKKAACCAPAALRDFKVEAIVTVDERGQMVLPKELREKAGIKAGDKLAAIALYDGKDVCCISLVKAGDLAEMVRNKLGPLMKDVF